MSEQRQILLAKFLKGLLAAVVAGLLTYLSANYTAFINEFFGSTTLGIGLTALIRLGISYYDMKK